MPNSLKLRLPEVVVPGQRLGRTINHDPRSLQYLEPESAPVTVSWDSHTPILDQGNLGSCTGNAETALLGTDPFFATIPAGVVLDEAFAVKLYSLATQLDGYPGQYPPEDTGSDAVSVSKAAQQDGLISGYTHATSLAACYTMIAKGPFIVGVNWYAGMDNPDANGVVQPTGPVRGGHELCVVGYDASTGLWKVRNSWGASWGQGGFCYWSDATMTRLLAEQGDATQATPITAPAPTPTPVPTPPAPTPTPTPATGLPAEVIAWAQRTSKARGWCVSKRDKAAADQLLAWHGTA